MDDSGVRRASFGQEGGELSYGSYLRVPELLSLQSLLSDPPAHDELLFIVVHQAYELWFKVMLFELESVRDRLSGGDAPGARHSLSRVHAVERVMIEHIGVIETMTPQDFLVFRSNLAPGSGFQSVQFREIEAVSGLKEPGVATAMAPTGEERARLEQRWAEPTVWDAFCTLLRCPRPPHAGRRRGRAPREPAGDGPVGGSGALLPVGGPTDPRRAVRPVAVPPRTRWSSARSGRSRGPGGRAVPRTCATTLDKRFYPGTLGPPLVSVAAQIGGFPYFPFSVSDQARCVFTDRETWMDRRARHGFVVALSLCALLIGVPSADAATVIHEYPLPTLGAAPDQAALGSDGNIWFAETFANAIARITPGGVVTEFPLPSPDAGPDRHCRRARRQPLVHRKPM